jgi:hypothetical protein
MSAFDSNQFKLAIMMAKRRCDQDKDWVAYWSHCLTAAAAAWTKDRGVRTVPQILSVSGPALEGAIKSIQHTLVCPHDSGQSAAEFLAHVGSSVAKCYDDDVQPLRNALEHIGIRVPRLTK